MLINRADAFLEILLVTECSKELRVIKKNLMLKQQLLKESGRLLNY